MELFNRRVYLRKYIGAHRLSFDIPSTDEIPPVVKIRRRSDGSYYAVAEIDWNVCTENAGRRSLWFFETLLSWTEERLLFYVDKPWRADAVHDPEVILAYALWKILPRPEIYQPTVIHLMHGISADMADRRYRDALSGLWVLCSEEGIYIPNFSDKSSVSDFLHRGWMRYSHMWARRQYQTALSAAVEVGLTETELFLQMNTRLPVAQVAAYVCLMAQSPGLDDLVRMLKKRGAVIPVSLYRTLTAGLVEIAGGTIRTIPWWCISELNTVRDEHPYIWGILDELALEKYTALYVDQFGQLPIPDSEDPRSPGVVEKE